MFKSTQRSKISAFSGLAIAVLGVSLSLPGCGLFGIGATKIAPVITARSIGAPYQGLAGKTLAVVINLPSATMDEYPGSREEIANFVSTQFREHLPTTRLLAPMDVVYWQQSTLNWQNLSARDIGRHFNVDRVLTIEVLEYGTRRPIGVSNLQGRLRATCKIYDTEAATPGVDAGGHFDSAWNGLIDAAWPPAKPLDPTQTNESAVRLRTLDSFADRLVRYFYEQADAGPSMRG